MGPKLNTDMDIVDLALFSHHYAENAAGHSGLDFALKSGVVRQATTISTTAAGAVTLADDTTNYIEVNPVDGTVSDNATGFTAGRIPLYTVVTASGAIGAVTDKRAFLALADDIPDTLTTKGDLLGFSTAYARLAVGTNNKILQAASGETTGLKWVQNTRGIAYCIAGALTTSLKAFFTAPCAMTVTGGKLEVGTAPTGAALICDIHKNGTTLFTTQGNRPTVADAGTSAAIAAPDVTSIAAGDRIALDIDQIGSTVAGSDLSLTLYCEVV